MVDTLLLRGLPYPDAVRLMAVETRKAQQPEIEPFTSPPTRSSGSRAHERMPTGRLPTADFGSATVGRRPAITTIGFAALRMPV
jgi:hypothetical protein